MLDIWNTKVEYVTQLDGTEIHYTVEAITNTQDGLRITADVQEPGLYSCGRIDTTNNFLFLYGYFECKAKIPKGQGFWSSFFVVAQAWPPEIDVFESLGLGNDTWLTVHKGVGDYSQMQRLASVDLSEDYHVYGVLWEEDFVAWYIDGQRVYYNNDRVPQVPMFLYLMFSVGGWAGAPDETTVFPAHYDVEYVKVWQRTP